MINGAIWCILSVPKYVIINLKINNFRIINQQHPKFCAICFSKINPDAHVSTKMNAITYNKKGGGVLGAIAPESQRNVKNGCFCFPCNDMGSDSS